VERVYSLEQCSYRSGIHASISSFRQSLNELLCPKLREKPNPRPTSDYFSGSVGVAVQASSQGRLSPSCRLVVAPSAFTLSPVCLTFPLYITVVPYPDCDLVIEARDINKVPRAPALYVRVALSGNKLGKTEIKRNSAPTWEDICSM